MAFFPCILSWAQDSAENILSDTCTIQQVSRVNSGTGVSETWSTRASGVACLVTVANGQQIESLVGQQEQSQIYYNVRVASDQTVLVTDRIVTSDGRTFDIIAIPKTTILTSLKLICKQTGAA